MTSEFKLRQNPLLYEINAVRFITGLSLEKTGLISIPDRVWEKIREQGFDLVWLMGIWQRSPQSRQIALTNKELRKAYDQILPGWQEEDIAGSPYAIYAYTLDKILGLPDDLAKLKVKLNHAGMGLILDFVPNHLARDHPWTISKPARFVVGTQKSVAAHPEWFYATRESKILAYGRDPNFAPWTDTAQVNFFSRDLRKAHIVELLKIAEVSDGVRCDMAMLGLNSVFSQVWGEVFKSRTKPETEFWAEAIAAVKAKYPHFIFMAEAYWGMEKILREMGFDFTYDKTLYDRLKHDKAEQLQDYIRETTSELGKTVHFIENHDEPRAPFIFGRERSLAAAVAFATIPGIRLFYEGQLEGKQVHLPVQMARSPVESSDIPIMEYYGRILQALQSPVLHEGSWDLLEAKPAWEHNYTFHNLLLSFWRYEGHFKLAAINYAAESSQARVKLPLNLDNYNLVISIDELGGQTYQSPTEEVRQLGLYIDLKPWQSHILDIRLK